MQRIKRTIMVALVLPVLYVGSCFPFSDTVFRAMRDATIDGTAQFIQGETFDFLSTNVGLGDG